MPDTYTAHYNFTQPEINASRDTWGNKHNANWASLDNILKAISDRIIQRDTAKAVGFVSGDKLHPYLRHTDDTVVRMTTPAEVDAAIMSWLPRGVILIWSGTLATIPAGWALCDGTRGTPNLNRRFVWGAGAGLAPVGGLGGGESHSHGGGTAFHAIDWNQMPPHSHGVADPGHVHHVNDPGHVHGYSAPVAAQNGSVAQGGRGIFYPEEGRATAGAATGIWLSGAATGISIHNAGSGHGHNHGIAADSHIPPYAILAYIMKL